MYYKSLCSEKESNLYEIYFQREACVEKFNGDHHNILYFFSSDFHG
jgi:hypothetical protein